MPTARYGIRMAKITLFVLREGQSKKESQTETNGFSIRTDHIQGEPRRTKSRPVEGETLQRYIDRESVNCSKIFKVSGMKLLR